MYLRFTLLLAVTFSPLLMQGQDTVWISKQFKFHDGVYARFEDFQRNRPSWSWDSLEVEAVTNPQTFLTQVAHIRFPDGRAINPDSIWGVAIGGIPYLRLPRDATRKPLTAFAGLQVTGILCYYNYETTEADTVEMKAYNPVTGVPFRKGKVERTQTVLHEYMLHFRSGMTAPLTREHLSAWTADDYRLSEAIAVLPDEDLQQKLFKGLLIYVDRNPVYTLK